MKLTFSLHRFILSLFIRHFANLLILVASGLDGPLMTQYTQLCAKYGLWASFGGFHEIANAEATKIRNTHVIVDPRGSIVAKYSKTHLFDVDIAGVF